MTHVFVMTNHKGGVGKSTTAVNLSFGIALALKHMGVKRNRVLLIDTDSQGHATLLTTGQNDFGREDSLYAVVTADREDSPVTLSRCIVQSTWHENLDVLPASALLESAERELIGVPGAPYRLAEPLSKISHQYAAIVIDTRPSFSLMTEMGIIASKEAFIPVEPRYLEVVGLQSVVNKIIEIREGWRCPHLRIGGIIVTKMDRRIKGHNELLESLQKDQTLGQLIYGVIPANEAVAYSHNSHLSVFQYDPGCAASLAYAQVVKLLVQRIVEAG